MGSVKLSVRIFTTTRLIFTGWDYGSGDSTTHALFEPLMKLHSQRSIAGASSGRTMVSVDIHLQSLRVARELSRRLTPNNPPHFVLADARYLPFAAYTFHGAFSYSVIQHFSRAVAREMLTEIGRVLNSGAVSVSHADL